MNYIIALAIFVVFFVILDLFISYRRKAKKVKEKQKSKFLTAQNYDTLYEDSPDSGTLSHWLDETTMLWGRPDLVLQNRDTGEVIVIDYKSGRRPSVMSMKHMVQLASYFMLVENEFGVRPARGIIKYLEDNLEHSIENDAVFNNETTVSALELAAIKRKVGDNTPDMSVVTRSHNDAVKCRICDFNKVCMEKL